MHTFDLGRLRLIPIMDDPETGTGLPLDEPEPRIMVRHLSPASDETTSAPASTKDEPSADSANARPDRSARFFYRSTDRLEFLPYVPQIPLADFHPVGQVSGRSPGPHV